MERAWLCCVKGGANGNEKMKKKKTHRVKEKKQREKSEYFLSKSFRMSTSKVSEVL